MKDYVETEKYIIEISSSREHFGYYDFTMPVEDNIYEERKWSLDFFVRVLTEEEDNEVAYISGTLFDENKLEERGLDIVEAADYIAQDEYDAAYWLSQYEGYKNEDEEEAWIWEEAFSGYLATFYVYEEYRNKGIAKYLFANIHKFLKHSLNINLRCLCIYPQPQNPENWSNISDEGMKKIMVRVIERNGFVKAGNEGYYAKTYDLAQL